LPLTVLDQSLDNETELEVLEHTTNTAGYTDPLFTQFDLLGMRFAPRIRDSATTRLCSLEGNRTAMAGFRTRAHDRTGENVRALGRYAADRSLTSSG